MTACKYDVEYLPTHLPVDERGEAQLRGIGEVMTEQRVGEGLPTRRRVNLDVGGGEEVGHHIASIRRVCGPVPVGESKVARRSLHVTPLLPCRVLVRGFLRNLQELLLEECNVHSVPAQEEDGVVRAVAVDVGAGGALADPVPVYAGHTMDATDLVVGELVGLWQVVEAAKGDQEQVPFIWPLRQLPYLIARPLVVGVAGACDGIKVVLSLRHVGPLVVERLELIFPQARDGGGRGGGESEVGQGLGEEHYEGWLPTPARISVAIDLYGQ